MRVGNHDYTYFVGLWRDAPLSGETVGRYETEREAIRAARDIAKNLDDPTVKHVDVHILIHSVRYGAGGDYGELRFYPDGTEEDILPDGETRMTTDDAYEYEQISLF